VNLSMRSLLSAALLLAPLARAAPPSAAPAVLRAAVVAQAAGTTGTQADDPGDEEEGEPSTTDEAPPSGDAAGAGADGLPVDVQGAEVQQTSLPQPGNAPTLTPGATSPARPRGELVSGAPLSNPDVAVHIVERKAAADADKHELTLYPLVAQANGKFTQHFGTAAAYTYHLQENFALQLTPQWNWSSAESDFNTELVNKVKNTAQAASSLLLQWGVQGGFEVTPVYGKFAFFEDSLLQFSVILNAGAGVGSTRHQLVPASVVEDQRRPATFGDTGLRFMGSVGGGFRVQMGDRLALRLEVRDLVYTARVDRVNGCTINDLEAIIKSNNGAAPGWGAGCNAAAFQDAEGRTSSADVAIARDLIREPSSDVLNLVNFYTGLSYLF
jgi:outer membrane beta-barrel protein